MAKSFSEEYELLGSGQSVGKHFVCFSTKGKVAATWADLDVHDLIGVRNLSNGVLFVTIPEENW